MDQDISKEIQFVSSLSQRQIALLCQLIITAESLLALDYAPDDVASRLWEISQAASQQ